MTNRNETLFNRARTIVPGGVSSPVRAFSSVDDVPRFIKKAQGVYVWDENGTHYTDYVGSWEPTIIEHAHPEVIGAVCEVASGGSSFGAPTEAEIIIAKKIARLVPSVEQLRLVSSGTEAVISAIRLVHGFTGRDKIIKLEGCYHGHSDSLLVKTGSGLLTFDNPSSVGVPTGFAKHTLVLEYSNTAQLEKTFEKISDEIACVIVEPFTGNMSLVRPSENFVHALRSLNARYGAVLICDEVMTDLRVVLDGAQSLHDITLDLTTMGKVIGGGMPLAAFGGRKDVMACVSPLGGVYQAGVLSGNPVAMAARLRTLEIIRREGFYESLTARTEQLVKGFQTAAAKADVAFTANGVSGMFGLYFADHMPQNYGSMARSNTDGFKHFFHGVLERDVVFSPSAYEAGFVSAAHTPESIDETVAAAETVFAGMAG